MAGALKPQESPADGLRRLLGKHLARARALLADRGELNEVEQILEVRKNCKRLRALARILRKTIGQEHYTAANIALRDAGRALAIARDAAVRIATLDLLLEHEAATMPEGAFTLLRADLITEHARLEESTDNAATFAQLIEMLKSLEAEVASWPLDDFTWESLESGLVRTLKQGKAARTAAKDADTSLVFHDWRKRIKDLQYQLDLCKKFLPPDLAARHQLARDIADLLGLEHDLEMLLLAVRGPSRTSVTEAEMKMLKKRIRAWQRELRADSLVRGKTLYALKPRRFVKAMRELPPAPEKLPPAPSLSEHKEGEQNDQIG